MKKKETSFAEKVDTDLKRCFGKRVVIINVQQKTKRGDADRVICLNGKFVALELKTEEGSPDTLQLIKLLEIRAAGGLAYLVKPSNWPDVLAYLSTLDK